MYRKLKLVCISFLFCSVFSTGYAVDTKQKSESEIQVLIDVSGSMKQNDPKNLRIPAIKLLVNLLPNGTKAGIWLFAQDTKVLVETGIVNEQWKKNALSSLNQIHSSGLFTNIEDAIQTSAKDWFNSTVNKPKRHLILLTDGMVDVSKDIMQSAESRERVLVEQIPLLQQAGVNVQAIALSEHADTELLNKLAFDTNGWSETAISAEQLQKVFFKIFKKAVPQDTVPLIDNAFNIDATIKEFSVLVFKKTGASDTKLLAPDNTQIVSANHVENVAWLEETSYDLITIKNPQPGKWKIVAEIDPDNQVMIITDLKLQMDEIPNHIFDKESFTLTMYFTDKDQLLNRKDFLQLIEISVEQMDELGGKIHWKMQPDPDKSGLFSQTIAPILNQGKYSITVNADGKTFQREIVQTFEIVESLIQIKTDVNVKERTVKLSLIVDQKIINTQMMTVQAIISQANKVSESKLIAKKDGKWELEIQAPDQGDKKIINFSVMAQTLKGNNVSPDIKPVTIDASLFFTSKPIPALVEENKTVTQELSKEAEEKVLIVEDETPVNWIKTTTIVSGVNMLLFISGFFVFKLMKKKAEQKQSQLLEKLA